MTHQVMIVEDDLAFAIKMERHIKSWGHNVLGSYRTGESFLDALGNLRPSLVVMDISLEGFLDGIKIAQLIKNQGIPIIFITQNNDLTTFDAVGRTKPQAFLVKPFDMLSLKGAIEFSKKTLQVPNDESASDADKYIFLKRRNGFNKILISDIEWIKSDKNYCDIFTNGQMYTEKISMRKLFSYLDSSVFLRIHKSYAVNINYITSLSYKDNTVTIGQQKIPIGRKNKKEVRELLNKHNPKYTLN